jgi:hypothetical protein
MKASNNRWADTLRARIPQDLAEEIDIFENEIGLRKHAGSTNAFLQRPGCVAAPTDNATTTASVTMANANASWTTPPAG